MSDQWTQTYEDQFDDYLHHEPSYIDRTLQLKKLFEMYRRPDFSWVPDFIDDLNLYPNSIQRIAEKRNIIFRKTKNQDKLFQAKYDHINNKYIIYINNYAIHCIKTGRDLDIISEYLIEVLTHEETHSQQNQLKSYEQPYYSEKMDEKYLSQYCEIDAFARQVARNIEYEYGFDADISDIIGLDKLTSLSKDIITSYYNIGGKVLDKFLKEIYNWFHEPEVKTSIEYKKWLFDHRRLSNE